VTDTTTTQAAAPGVTKVRHRLVNLSNRMYDQSQPYVAQFVVPAAAPTPPHERAIRDAAEGLVAGNVFTFTLAAVLRVAQESDHPAGPILAARMARIVSEALNSGLDWIGDANDDLPEDGEPQEPVPGQLEIPATATP